jgi:hypothetical protein
MSRVSLLAGVCALMAMSSGPARAQSSPIPSGQSVPLASAEAIVTASPQVERTLVGSARLGVSPLPVSNATVVRDELVAVPAAGIRHRGPGVALMIVGAAGVVTGLLINESLITVLGAGVGLVGLYIYVR